MELKNNKRVLEKMRAFDRYISEHGGVEGFCLIIVMHAISSASNALQSRQANPFVERYR